MIFEAERQKRKVIHGLSRYQPAFLLTRTLYITNIYFKKQINVREDQQNEVIERYPCRIYSYGC